MAQAEFGLVLYLVHACFALLIYQSSADVRRVSPHCRASALKTTCSERDGPLAGLGQGAGAFPH
jgi:hypothetical protein